MRTELEIQEIINFYKAGNNTSKTARKFKMDFYTLKNLLSDNGIEFRKATKDLYNLNENFFEIIDNEIKSYWLGFIAADGTVGTSDNIIGIELHRKDLNHLYKLKSALNSNHKIYHRQNRIASRLQFCNGKIKNDLINHSITPAKSLTLKFPTTIPDDLIRHFIRGYFDGDGSVSLTGVKSCRLELICTKEFSGKILEVFQSVSNAGEKLKLVQIGKNTFRVKIDTGKYAFKVLQYLYEDSEVYLDRKHDIYKLIKSKRI